MKFQSVQNAVAHLTMHVKKFQHILPTLKQLHWLPVQQHIIYKIMVLVYKALHDQNSSYIKLLPGPQHPKSPLISSKKLSLTVPNYNKKSYGAWAFSVFAPYEYNNSLSL